MKELPIKHQPGVDNYIFRPLLGAHGAKKSHQRAQLILQVCLRENLHS
jgi:hypothetical protein